MPLVVVCGLPSSGKSRRTEELRRALAGEGRAVYVVDDASVLGAQDSTVYGDSGAEKALRAALRAAVERRLSRQDVVILDSINYIKGFRYELYCLARAVRTPLCLVYCVRPSWPSRGLPVAGASENPDPAVSVSWRPRAQTGEQPRMAGAVEEQRASSPVANGGVPAAVPKEPDPEEILPSNPPAVMTPESEKSAEPASCAFPPELLESLALSFEAPTLGTAGINPCSPWWV